MSAWIAAPKGETPKQREARLVKNADRQRRRDEEAAQDANG
jgi:hypothetical protein